VRESLSDFGVVMPRSPDQGGNQGTEQGSAPHPSVVDELKEAEIEW
jgi:hypothetical protein